MKRNHCDTRWHSTFVDDIPQFFSQAIFHSDGDYQRMTDGLAKTVSRTGWQVLAYVWMPNHIHLFVRTPKPNLSRGMQYLLSGYAKLGHWFKRCCDGSNQYSRISLGQDANDCQRRTHRRKYTKHSLRCGITSKVTIRPVPVLVWINAKESGRTAARLIHSASARTKRRRRTDGQFHDTYFDAVRNERSL